MFSSIMLSFLKVGPVTSWQSCRPRTPLFIGRLVLDFLPVEDGKDIMPREAAPHDMLPDCSCGWELDGEDQLDEESEIGRGGSSFRGADKGHEDRGRLSSCA